MKEEVRKYRERKSKEFPIHYAIKYKIVSTDLTHRELMEAIYKFEMKHISKLIQNGIDDYTNEYGYYLIS